MVKVPPPAAVTRPVEEMVATAGVVEDQATLPERFCVLPSLKVPVAVNCCVAFLASARFAGVTVTVFSVAAVTVRAAVPVMAPAVALIIEVPADLAVARPDAVTVATEGAWEVQLTLAVMSCEAPSAKWPVALNCWVAPTVRETVDGKISI